MKIRKQNGKVAGKVTHQLADTIMETSITASCLLTDEAKKELILSIWEDETIENLNEECDCELNHKCAFLMAMETWSKGWYADLDVIPSTVVEYFIAWGR